MFILLFEKIRKNKGLLIVATFIVLASLAWFYKFFFFGQLPFPGDLLVSFFFPWNSGGFTGYDQWTTHKDVIAADVIRQMYPWKSFAFDQIRLGQIPLWNPYNFSGYPLIANLQSGVFFPGNIVYLLLPNLWAYISLVLFLPSLLILFTYLFLRSLNLRILPSIFGGIVALNLGYIIVWHEQLIITQVALFLPLILWMVNKYCQTKKTFYLFLISLFICFAVFAGHAQTFIYLSVVAGVYMLFKRISIIKILLVFGLGALMSAPQLFPTMEIYLYSAREGAATKALFAPFILPWENLATIIAPDFFGNPAVGNFWGKEYGDFLVYFGLVGAFFSVVGAMNYWKKGVVKMFLIMGGLGLLFALWPLVYIPHILNIPILASGVPARVIYIFQFCFAILAAFGLESLYEKKFAKRDLIPVGIMGACLLVLWAFGLKIPVAKSNLYLPTFIFLLNSGLYLLIKFSKFRFLIFIFLIFSLMEYSYLFNKYQPFAPAKFVFPSHPVTRFLQQKGGLDRYFGFGTAYIDSNFATLYKIYAPEGWDSLYIKRYGELLASTNTGRFPKVIKRSDAIFGAKDNSYRNRLFDILGVKYILDKNDNPLSNWEEMPEKFPLDRYKLNWQSYKWKAYERLTSLPRAKLMSSFEVVKDDHEIINRMYANGFDYKDSLILEKEPIFSPAKGLGSAKITGYSPNRIKIKTDSKVPKLLFLSDTFFPGWKATIDGKTTEIFRADYIFRAVAVPSGKHVIIFQYDPISFKAGVLVTLLALSVWIILLFKKNK